MIVAAVRERRADSTDPPYPFLLEDFTERTCEQTRKYGKGK